jgi:hypothetical protein
MCVDAVVEFRNLIQNYLFPQECPCRKKIECTSEKYRLIHDTQVRKGEIKFV